VGVSVLRVAIRVSQSSAGQHLTKELPSPNLPGSHGFDLAST